jgi:hypothetical protein
MDILSLKDTGLTLCGEQLLGSTLIAKWFLLALLPTSSLLSLDVRAKEAQNLKFRKLEKGSVQTKRRSSKLVRNLSHMGFQP